MKCLAEYRKQKSILFYFQLPNKVLEIMYNIQHRGDIYTCHKTGETVINITKVIQNFFFNTYIAFRKLIKSSKNSNIVFVLNCFYFFSF